jgi:hypothetical protein
MILSAIATELKQHAKGDFKRRHYEAALQVPEAHKSAYANGSTSARPRCVLNLELLNSKQPLLTGLSVRETVVIQPKSLRLWGHPKTCNPQTHKHLAPWWRALKFPMLI